jgi:broad specificity phosphatase PhoE
MAGMSPATLYLLRHGETEWNRFGRFQGRLDSPLTARGRAQAQRMGEALRELIAPPRQEWSLISSPLGRARTTAVIVGRVLGIAADRIASDPRLAEIDVGEWTGRAFDEVDSVGEGPRAARRGWQFHAPGGEGYDAVAGRLGGFLAEVAPDSIVVTHGITGLVLRTLYLGLSREDGLRLEVTQDAFFRLAGGRAERIACAAP